MVNSHCMSCGHKLVWYDLFPLFSYLFLKGRCRYCGSKLSYQYPLIELLNGILYLVVFGANGMNVESVLFALLVSALLTLSVIDYRTLEIPVRINAVILGIGIVHIIFDLENWIHYLIGFFSASLFLFLCLIITRGKGIGGGDIKLMAASGWLLGWRAMIPAIFLGLITGGCYCIWMLARKKMTRKDHFAFGPFLALGLGAAFFYGDEILRWYLAACNI